MEDSKEEEEENGWMSQLRERQTGSWRLTRSKVKNVVTEQSMRNNGRERISKKNALCRIKLISELNSEKATSKNRKLQNYSDEDSEIEETWNEIQEIDPPQPKEAPKPIQTRISRRKVPPHLNRITPKSNQYQDGLQTHLVSDEGVPLKSEDDMEFVYNAIKLDEESDFCFEPLLGDEEEEEEEEEEVVEEEEEVEVEEEEVMDVKVSFPLKAEMDPIKSEVDDNNKDLILTKLVKTVKMEINETKPVYPVALISVKRQSEHPDLSYFNPSHDHSIELATIDTKGEILRNEQEAEISEEDANNFAFISLDEASNEMEEMEEIESSYQIKTNSVNCQQQDVSVVSDMPVNNVEKVSTFSDNTCKVISMEEFSNIPIALPCIVKTLNGNAECDEFMLVPSRQGNKNEPTLRERPISKPVISQLTINNPSLSKHSPRKHNSKVASTGVRQRRPINILSKRRRPNVKNVINLQNEQLIFLSGEEFALLPNNLKNNVPVRLDTFS